MFLKDPAELPDMAGFAPSPGMAVAARRLMSRFTPSVERCLMDATNHYDWSMTLFGPPPTREEVVQVAEELGHDVRHFTPLPERAEWDLELRSVEARDPDVRKELIDSVASGYYANVTM